MDFRQFGFQSKLSNILPDEELREHYLALSDLLSSTHSGENNVTRFESELKCRIREKTRLKFEKSIWIGRRNIDLFSFAIKGFSLEGKVSKGLAIEVDGGIHNIEFKMKKDQSKYKGLYSLGIAVSVIENHDLNHPCVVALIEGLKSCKRLDTRARDRLRRNIYIYTLVQNINVIENHMALPEKTLKTLKWLLRVL